MDPRQQNSNNDIFALHTGVRPIERETTTNAAAIKKQRVEKQQLTPASKLILEHLGQEKAKLMSPMAIDWKSVKTDEDRQALQVEQMAIQMYIKKLDGLALWIQTRVK